jgi:hypothetical protein
MSRHRFEYVCLTTFCAIYCGRHWPTFQGCLLRLVLQELAGARWPIGDFGLVIGTLSYRRRKQQISRAKHKFQNIDACTSTHRFILPGPISKCQILRRLACAPYVWVITVLEQQMASGCLLLSRAPFLTNRQHTPVITASVAPIMMVASTCETSVNSYRTTRRSVPAVIFILVAERNQHVTSVWTFLKSEKENAWERFLFTWCMLELECLLRICVQFCLAQAVTNSCRVSEPNFFELRSEAIWLRYALTVGRCNQNLAAH